MKKAINKNIIREISKSKARFISIFAMISLGVAFFAGLNAIAPTMLHLIETYYQEQYLMDLRIQSDVGMTADQVDDLAQLTGVRDVLGSYSFDSMEQVQGKNLKVMSYEHEQAINQVVLLRGEWPVTPQQVLVDEALYGIYQVGDTIELTQQGEQVIGLERWSFEISGFVKSPLFIQQNTRGASTIGTGTSAGFVLVDKDLFDSPVYTEVYLTLEALHGVGSYSATYDDMLREYQQQVEALLQDQAGDHLEALLAEPLQQLAEAELQLENNRAQLAQLPEPQRSMMQASLDEAQQKLDQQRAELQAVAKPQYFVFGRKVNPGYFEYQMNMTSIASIAQYMPILFFAIAALVTLTTMTRMVEEKRMEAGTMKALGYTTKEISRKFLVYAALSGISGAIVGFYLGSMLFPRMIYQTFLTMFAMPPFEQQWYYWNAFFGIFVSLLCTVGITYLTVRKELKESTVTLMRPKAPKAGQQILLEKMPFIWQRMSFAYKVTVRNLFRYKQRMVMTVVGVAGCTALLVTGFGLDNTLQNIPYQQFSHVVQYDGTITLDAASYQEQAAELDALVASSVVFQDTLPLYQENFTARKDEQFIQNVLIQVPADTAMMQEYIHFRTPSGAEVPLTDDGVVVSRKLAELLELQIGDSLRIENINNQPYHVTITGIYENYSMHYLFMTPTYYEQVFGEAVAYNSKLFRLNASGFTDKQQQEYEDKLYAFSSVLNISYTADVKETVEKLLSSTTAIVLLLIVSAALLAFVVLYNLTNINVSERMRELSTIKVLGFYPHEVSLYVYRETIILTMMGIMFGWLLGVGLLYFIMNTMEMELILMVPYIKMQSYVYAAILTLFFSLLVMVTMHQKLKHVDMLEALKSVE